MKTFMQFVEGVKNGIPHVNQAGADLAAQFNLRQHKTSAFNQTEGNCYEVAAELAKKFGYNIPNKNEIAKLYEDFKFQLMQKQWGGTPRKLPELNKPSLAYLVVRDPNSALGIHVAFEYKGKEYNYGEADAKVLFKLPLTKINT